MRPSGAPRETSAYPFDLPADLIAKTPAEPRDASRLLVLARDGPPVDAHFSDFPSRLRAGDVLVLNETRVIRARLIGKRKGGAPAEYPLAPAGALTALLDRGAGLAGPGASGPQAAAGFMGRLRAGSVGGGGGHR